ncbi:glycoside hydrolase family 2 TIM barrel-domain containing protein [Microbacterium excoecariae]|uniref:glycoside hydrolase family 2 TIM barrel-domain containing protein n=1 Tax=Microbacterium excoecariae TaxID=2715210 RepID=UPI00140C2A70|nr:glycoside hydrolase family 2 TIM barrel-domain containing protein [Microbacterium excoecariae]NHI15795.1 glycoside hydrolase family 2 protein [Microbacterium excoecariae]
MTRTPLTDGWRVRAASGPFAAVAGEEPARPVRLPHDALRDAERTPDAPGRGAGAYYPGGAFAYLRDLEVPASWREKTILLELEGVYRRAQVFVDDELAGNRADGYARFFVDLTPYLRFGGTSRIRIEARAGQDSRWYSGAGLHRPAHLHVLDAVHIAPDGVTVATLRVEDEEAIVEVRTAVRNTERTTRTVRVASSIARGGEVDRDAAPVTLASGETALVRHRLAVPAPRLWSPDDPALYEATVALDDADPVTVTFGIRTVTADARRGLRINGEPVLLRGACVHHDNGPLGAAAVGRAEERRVELLKAAGFNAIRASHNPLSVAMLDACDRLGMLVMDEAFDMWTRFKTPFDYAADFPQWWEEDLRALVAKDRNHPSVILYSLGNEIAEVGTPHGARWARRLAEHVRALDPTRLITNGVNALLAVIDEVPQIVEEKGGLNQAASEGDPFNEIGSSDTATRRIEESSSVLDVVGLNYADARYAADGERYPHRVIVGSETFAGQIGRLWPLVEAHPHVIGDFTWTGWDYLGEVGIGSTAYADDPTAAPGLEREFPFLTAWTGDIDITGHRRPVSYYREIAFGLRAEPYIAVRRPAHHGSAIAQPSPWAWSDAVSSWTWRGFEERPVTVEVYARAERVRLLLDGREIGEAAVGEDRPLVATFETTYRPGRLEAIALEGGVEVGREVLETAGDARLVALPDRERIRDDAEDLAFVALELRDAQGRLVADDDVEVRVEVQGPAELSGMASANPKTAERFDASAWRTFDGRALAVLRPTGPGTVRIRAVSPRGEAIARVEVG